MVLTLPAVKVFSPIHNVEMMECWRNGRTDHQLRVDYQRFIWNRYSVLIPLDEIQVGHKRAA
jgi:hypothetical protein